MRERSIVWDILMVALLALMVVISAISLLQNTNLEKSSRQSMRMLEDSQRRLREVHERVDASGRQTAQALDDMKHSLEDLRARGVAVNTNANVNANPNTQPAIVRPGQRRLKSYDDGSKVPAFKRGDENADDGDTLVVNEISEPNSLNPVVDNDATGADLFKLCNDYLADRAFDDLKTWEPKLARAWDKAMICRGIAAKKNAKELAALLNQKLSAAEKDKFAIANIVAESDEILRIELEDATGDYREPVLKLLGEGALAKQYWLYVNFEGEKFTDGTAIDAKSVGQRVRDAIQAAPDFKGSFLPDWVREGSVVIELTGDGKAAENAVRALINSPKNQGEVVDAKSTSGKTVKKVLTFDLIEDYDLEEKPVFTFYIRPGVKWHDGEPFTGKDVIFSYNTMMNPKVESSSIRNYYVDCEKCELVDGDPMTVRYTWKKPYFLAFGYSCELYLFPEHVFKYNDAAEFNKTPKNQWIVGTGPFRLTDWKRKVQLTLARNDDYWGRKVHLNKINALFVNDTAVALQMLKAGELDIHGMTKPQAKQHSTDEEFKKKFTMIEPVANFFFYVGWNIRKPKFASEKTRRALTMLTDRERIVTSIMRGYAQVIDEPTHPESPNYSTDPKLHVPFDIEGAKKLLAEDGWADTDGDHVLDKMINGERVAFKFNLLMSNGSPDFESVANLMKDTYALAGVQLNIQTLEWSVMLQNVERLNFDAMISGWQVDLDDDPYQLFHSSQTIEKGSNHCGYVNKDVDHWIEIGRRELNEKRRNELFKQVYETIAKELPYTTLFCPKRNIAYDKRVQNISYNLKGKDLRRWWVPKELQKVK